MHNPGEENECQVRKSEIETATARTIDMKLEIVVIPVSDVDRAKAFYAKLGWRLDADFAAGDDFRVDAVHAAGLRRSVSSARMSPRRRRARRRACT